MARSIEKWFAAGFLALLLTQPAFSASENKRPEKVFGWVEEGVLVPVPAGEFLMRLLPLVLALLLCACAQQPPKDDSLYQALGARAGITRIVEGMLLNIARDEQIADRFRKIDMQRLRDKLIEQFCVVAVTVRPAPSADSPPNWP
jgi:hypothetical protein